MDDKTAGIRKTLRYSIVKSFHTSSSRDWHGALLKKGAKN